MISDLRDVEVVERVPLDQQMDCWTIDRLIARGVAINPDRVALYYLEDGTATVPVRGISYQALHARLGQAVALYKTLGVTARTAVGIVLPNVPQNYMAMLAASMAGIAFPINWMLSGEQIASLLRAARVKVVVCLAPAPGFDIWEKISPHLPPDLSVIHVSLKAGEADPAIDFDRLCDGQPEQPPSVASSDPDRVAFYIHTGGTTGLPKIARVSHRNIAYKCFALRAMHGERSPRTLFSASPLFHIGGIVLHAVRPLSEGHSCVVPGALGFRHRPALRDYWKLVARFGIAELTGVPTLLGALSEIPVGGADISSLHPFASTGSAPLPVSIARYFENEIGIQVRTDYGATETTASVTAFPHVRSSKYGASGLRLPFTEIRIARLDHDGRVSTECMPDEAGEVLVRGPGVIPGYLDSRFDPSLFVEDGWARTGDIGRLDRDGYLWIIGRAKDVIIRSGHNIDPLVIEDAIMQHSGVALAAAVGKPDAFAGELPIAFVQLKPGVDVSVASLMEFVRSRVPERAAAPVDIFIVEALPVTDLGKISKVTLRARATHDVVDALVARIVPDRHRYEIRVVPDGAGTSRVDIRLTDDVWHSRRIRDEISKGLARFSFQVSIGPLAGASDSQGAS